MYDTLAAGGLEELFSSCAVVSVFWLQWEIIFGVTYKLTVQYKMGRRNMYLEGRDGRQITPHGYANFDSD
jgi:hypothetical protein